MANLKTKRPSIKGWQNTTQKTKTYKGKHSYRRTSKFNVVK
jgi:hypothetical protein